MTAAYYGNKSLIKLLLEYNASYSILDSNGKSAWEIAQEMKQYSCTDILLNLMTDHRAALNNNELEKGKREREREIFDFLSK